MRQVDGSSDLISEKAFKGEERMLDREMDKRFVSNSNSNVLGSPEFKLSPGRDGQKFTKSNRRPISSLFGGEQLIGSPKPRDRIIQVVEKVDDSVDRKTVHHFRESGVIYGREEGRRTDQTPASMHGKNDMLFVLAKSMHFLHGTVNCQQP